MYDIQHCFICRPSAQIPLCRRMLESNLGQLRLRHLPVRRPNHSIKSRPKCKLWDTLYCEGLSVSWRSISWPTWPPRRGPPTAAPSAASYLTASSTGKYYSYEVPLEQDTEPGTARIQIRSFCGIIFDSVKHRYVGNSWARCGSGTGRIQIRNRSFPDPEPVLRIRDRIRAQTNGPGSCYILHWPSRRLQKTLLKFFFTY